MSRRQAVIAALLGGLLAGTWLGASLDRHVRRRLRRGGPDVERTARLYARGLGLDEAQTAKVREALGARRERYEKLRREYHERFRALRAEIDADIERVLSEEQKRRFAEKRARWEKRRDAR